jgi:hypothetical protein
MIIPTNCRIAFVLENNRCICCTALDLGFISLDKFSQIIFWILMNCLLQLATASVFNCNIHLVDCCRVVLGTENFE